MHRPRVLMRAAAAVALAAALPVALTGCDPLLLQHEVSGTAADSRALELAWRTPASEPTWIPSGAAPIRYAAATAGGADAAPAAVRAATARPLPASCTGAERRSEAGLHPSWAPQVLPEQVRRCGNWAVMPVDGGWFGWTPFAPPQPAGAADG